MLLITVAVICTNSVTALPDGGGNQAYSSNSANIDQASITVGGDSGSPNGGSAG